MSLFNQPNPVLGEDELCKIDVHGFRPDEVSIELKGDEIVIKGEHRSENFGKTETRQLERRVRIPDGMNKDSIRAYHDNFDRICITGRKPISSFPLTSSYRPIEIKRGFFDNIKSNFDNLKSNFDDFRHHHHSSNQPSNNVIEQEEMNYKVEVHDFRPEELKVEMIGNEVVVKGEHRLENNGKTETRSLERRVQIPPGVHKDSIKASISDGTLCITAKKISGNPVPIYNSIPIEIKNRY